MSIPFLVFTVIFAIIAFFLGAALASFMGVVFERGRKGESILGRSHCACGRLLKASENIPVIGWLKTHGIAPCCGSKLSPLYIICEALTGAVFGLTVGILFFVSNQEIFLNAIQ